ncbi:LysM domain-containing protein [Lactiplantibacillus plantarum]
MHIIRSFWVIIGEIAKRFNTSVNDLVKLNGKTIKKYIYPGEKLR